MKKKKNEPRIEVHRASHFNRNWLVSVAGESPGDEPNREFGDEARADEWAAKLGKKTGYPVHKTPSGA